MLKQKKYDWKDTNLAKIGSDEDIQARLDSAETERAWDGAGEKPELKVWRVEKFKIKAWPTSKYGQFHTGDSYIVLHTYKQSEETNKLSYDIFFWIGDESTQDEYGTAAYKTVELDAKFRDAAVQHREVQYHETEEFKALFKSKLVYLEGGVETGFHHVGEPESRTPELFRVKGVKDAVEFVKIKCRRDYMTSDDVYILDTWLVIYQWNGKDSNAAEKMKAGGYLDSVVSARGGECKKIVLDEGHGDHEGPDAEAFWSLIPGEWRVGCVPLATYAVQPKSKVADEDVRPFAKQLFKLTDNGQTAGELSFKRVSKGKVGSGKGNKVAKQKLNSHDVYILDDGFIIWVWIGKEASSREKGQGFSYAMKYIKAHARPAYMPIRQIREGAEPLTFTECLHNEAEGTCNIL